MRHGEDGDERSIRCVRTSIDAELAVEDRLAADDRAVDDLRLTDRQRLRNRQIAGVDEVLGLKVHLELVRNPEGIARRGECVECVKEHEEQDRRPAARRHFSDSIHACHSRARASARTTSRRSSAPVEWARCIARAMRS